MIYLITGGGGYLGSWLARELVERGDTVRVLDVARTQLVSAEVDFTEADIRDRGAVRQMLQGVDIVFHLAFVQSMSQRPMGEREDINLGGMRVMLEESRLAKVRRFVHTSTIEIYGTNPPYPCPESAAKQPVGWYGEHKMSCEQMLWQFCADTGLAATALRMPNICGPGYYNHRGLIGLMDRIIDGRDAIKIDEGETLADLVHYRDVLQGYLLAAERPEAAGQAFNISCREPSTHIEIMRAMRQAVRSKTKFWRVPRAAAATALRVINAFGIVEVPEYQQAYMLENNCYDITKAKTVLGYDPQYSAAEAGAELIRHYEADRDGVRRRSRSY